MKKSSKKKGQEGRSLTDLTVKKDPVRNQCNPTMVPEGSIYQLLREVLGPAFMSFRGDGLNSGLSMPCWMYEPISILQRAAEMFEYTELLEKAALCKDSINRLAFVTAFIISIYSSTPNRFKINFNPILGETFEMVDDRFEDKIRYFSEQVSHHPPRTATHAYNSKWTFMQNYHPTTAFLGNNVNLDTHYRTYIEFKESGDKFFIEHPLSKIHNIMMGTTWLEHYGNLTVTNTKTGDKCNIEFKKASFMSGPNYKIEGEVTSNKQTIIKIGGTWNGTVKAQWSKDTKDFESGTSYTLWEMAAEDWTDKAYRLTDFALSFNYVNSEMKKYTLPTDSRRRLDIRYLLKGEDKRATAWKQVGETKQRDDEKVLRSKVGESEDFWTPVWFKLDKDHQAQQFWYFTNTFWDERSQREQTVSEGKEVELYYAGSIKESAADFSSYRRLFSDSIDKYLGEIRQKENENEKTKDDIEKEKEALAKQLAESPDDSDASTPSSPGKTKKGKK